jgi:hypothetical protein
MIILSSCYKKLKYSLFLLTALTFLTAMSTSDYTRQVDPLPDMPKGNPDPSLGIVIHPNSTAIDVLSDSSQAIRFRGTTNYSKTYIEQLSSSSMRDYVPKKFKFIDEKHGFTSDGVFEYTMTFSRKNKQWKFIRFMPFPSVNEWVTEEKLRAYLDQWVKTFEDAGWKRVERPQSDNPRRMQNFTLPASKHDYYHQYCSWTTDEYEAVIEVYMRNREDYKYYIPKAERKNIKIYLDGYIAFIEITKNSQYQ